MVANTPLSTAVVSNSVILTAVNGEIGTAAGSPMIVNSGGSGLLLDATANGINPVHSGSAPTGQGQVWVQDNSNTELVTLNNGTPLSASVSFNLVNNNGGIAAISGGSLAIASPVIALTANGGNISATGNPGFAALSIASSTSGSGVLNLSAVATTIGGNGGSIAFVDNVVGDQVQILNGTATSPTPISAGASLLFAASGNISATTAAITAITSPLILLATSGGNISANGAANGAALLVNSGGSVQGLRLIANATTVNASGGVVNLTDNAKKE